MPWSPGTFKSRHNKHLSSKQADKAARMANAILRRTGNEGLAIATANARAKGMKPKHHAQPFGSLAP